MKSSKLAILASFFALAVVNLASAQITIRITGSTAFRAATHQAILHIIQPATLNYGYTGTSFNSATEAIVTGTTTAAAGSVTVIIKTAWSGSVGGVFTLATNGPAPDPGANPPITAGWLVNSTPMSPGGTPNAPLTFDAPVTADIAMSDSFQSSTPFKSPALHDTVVGVVPFVWVRNAGAPAALGNMTNQLAKVVLNNPVSRSRWLRVTPPTPEPLCMRRAVITTPALVLTPLPSPALASTARRCSLIVHRPLPAALILSMLVFGQQEQTVLLFMLLLAAGAVAVCSSGI